MKRFKQLLTVFLAIVMCFTTIVPVRAATPLTQDGITLMVTPDKTEYSQDETITATVTVENTNDFAVTDVSLEGITPEGYELKLKEGDSLTIGELAAKASKQLEVSFVPKTGEGDDDTEDVVVYFKENFEYEGETPDYFVSTNQDPQGIYVPTKAGTTVQAAKDGNNKVLNIIGSSASGSAAFQVDARWSDESSWSSDTACVSDLSSKHVVYEFDLKLQGTAGNSMIVRLKSVKADGSGNAFSTLIKIDNNVLNINNATLSLETDYHIAIVCDFITKTRDVYVYLNGTCISEENLAMTGSDSFNSAKVSDFVSFTCWAAKDADILIDNLAVYESEVPMDIDFEETENGGEGEGGNKEPVEVTEGEKIYATDLELSNPFIVAAHDNIIEWIAEPGNEQNKVLRFERKNAKDFHIDLKGLNTDSDSVVYDFDVKLLNASETMFRVLLKDDDAKYSTACSIIESGIITDRSGQSLETAALKDNEWNNIAVVYDYKNRVSSIYVNGTVVAEDIAMETTFGDSDKAGLLRFYCPILDETAEGFDINNHNVEFMVDNVRVYEGTKPSEELTEAEVVITIDPNKSVFEDAGYNGKYSTSSFDTLLTGYMSLHTRNGMVYKDGIKTKLATMPIETETGFLVVATEICEVLDIICTVNGNTVEINNKQADVVSKDGKLWIDAQYFFEEILGKTVSIDTTAKSDGMMIAGDSAFTWPTEVYAPESVFSMRTGLQNLNDYLFFERPTAETLLDLYEDSALYEVHPRIQATAEDFAAIKKAVETNSLMSTWYQQLITAADYLVEENTEALKYELRDNVRLLYVSRDMLDHMYTLGMAYQLTGEQKYVDRAWIDLYAVSTFKDWHPEHDIDPAEMSAAVAIGYDWMYAGLSEVQRETIEKGVYKNCFYDASLAYQSRDSKLAGGALSGINHNIVLNGGFAMGALAFMDEYPEVSSYILSGAIRAADIMLTEYGPDGAWKEGPGYWEYATQYTSKMLSSLETVFGTCFSLDACEGLSTAANYILNLQSDQGIFNYGDGSADNFYVPELFYLANKYGDKGVTSSVLELNNGKMLDNENVVLSLLWYDTDVEEGSATMPLDGVYWTEGVASFRDAWTDGVTTYVGIHGGYTQVCHAQVDGGTFVYDYAGIRWAKELGVTPYDVAAAGEYGVDGKRWLLYRSRAEAHNTIVINPDNSAGQVINSTAKLTRFESDNKGGIAVLDMSENYAENASKAIRGFFFTDDRTSLVVRDEISLSKDDSTIYWFMQTDAEVDIAEGGKSATLTQAGKTVTLEFVTSGTVGEATLSVGISTRMTEYSTSPITGGTTSSTSDVESPNVNRIAIKLTGASGDVAITTKLTPAGVNSTSVEDYDVSISTWAVPEGEIASKPEVQSVVIDGREIKFDSANQATFLCVEGKYGSVPTASVTVDETKYTYEVTDAESTDGGTTTIIVKDKNNANVYTTYMVNLEEIPVAAVPNEDRFAGMTALQVIAAEASEEPEANVGNVAWKTLDQKTATSWTAQGIGHWILLELEEESTVDNLILRFKNGYKRSTYFNVSVSTDGVNYEQVYSGKSGGKAMNSTTDVYEQFALGGKTAKYIRIGCNGNDADGMTIGWNNISEIVFTGTVVETTPTPTPGTEATPTPGPSTEPETEPTPTPGAEVTPTPSTTPDADDSVDVTIVSESTNTSYTKSSTNKVTIYCTGEHTELVGVDMDGKEVAASNYTVTKGSTIVEFKNEYLETLTVGEHTVTLRYTEARSVNSKLTIIAKTSSDTEKKPEVEEDYSDNNESSNSAEDATTAADVSSQTVTGDNSNPLLWSIVSLLAISGAVTLSVIYRKRFKGILSLLLVCVLLAGMVPTTLNVHAEGTAASNTKTLTATENVTVGENTVSIGFKLTYTLPEEEPSAPVITIGTQPTAAEVKVGEKATLTVAATATENATITYQWYSCADANKTNATAVNSATEATYEVTPTVAGTVYYYCVVSAEGAEGVASSVVAVTATAEAIDTPVVYYEEDFEYTGETADYLINQSADPKGVYVQSGTAAPYKETDGNTVLRVTPTNAAYQINARWSDKETWSDSVNHQNLQGKSVVYEFELTPNGEITGTPGISNLTVALRSQNGGTALSTICTISNNELSFANDLNKVIMVNSTSYNIAVVNKYGYDTDSTKGVRDIYVNGVPVATNVAIRGSILPSAMGDFIRFFCNSAVTADFNIDDICVYEQASVITIDKDGTTSSATVKVGDEATLNVAATTDTNTMITYQWYSCVDTNKTNATVINGATNATYKTIPNSTGNTYYFCKLSADSAVSKVTDVITVTAEEASTIPVVIIQSQPTAIEVEVNQKATLEVIANVTENATATYQWYRCDDANKTNVVAVDGANSAKYEATPAAVGIDYYYCEISAEGAVSVDSDVVSVSAYKMIYEESFEYMGETAGYLITQSSAPFGVYVQSGTAAPYQETDNNTVLKVTPSNAKYQINVRWSDKETWSDSVNHQNLQGKSIVYEFELTPNGEVNGTSGISNLRVALRSQNGGTVLSTIGTVSNNVLKFADGIDTITMVNGTSYKIAVVNKYGQDTDSAKGVRDIYVNGESIATNIAIPGSSILPSAMNDFIRFYCDSAVTADFNIDDICVYESQVPIKFN